MGYRTYIQVVKKDIIEDLHNCKTIEDLIKVQDEHKLECFTPKSEFNGSYFSVYRIPHREQFEFGKFCDGGRDTYQNTQDVFTTPELQELVEENAFRFGGVEVIKAAIDWTEKRIIEMYQNLIDCKSDWIFEQHEIDSMTNEEKKNYHYDMLLEHCLGYFNYWKTEIPGIHAYNDNREKSELSNDWLYEHTFWDLVRMWKEFDVENELILFIGW